MMDAMTRTGCAVLALSLCAAAGHAQETDEAAIRWGALLDLRAARSSGSESWLAGGLGKTRYGALDGNTANLLALGQASLVADARLSEILGAHVQLNFDAEPDPAIQRARAGLVEAFAFYRPEPTPRLRLRLKGGVFFPAISLEHPGVAWSTAHTVTPSAINAWVGEELRSTGLEAVVAWSGDRHELSLLTSVFSNNDPAGTLLSWRGWAMHDRQTAVFDQLALPPIASLGPGGEFVEAASWTSPVREIDGRLGYQVGAEWSMRGVADVRASFWDNNGDPAAFDGFQYAWYTEFLSLGARVRLPAGVEAVAQYMDGTTEMGEEVPGRGFPVDNRFRAAFVLLTGARGPHRLTGRYDWFEVEDRDLFRVEDANDEDGHGWTLAYLATLGEHARLALEWLEVTSTRASRMDLGLAPRARERQLQASLRISF